MWTKENDLFYVYSLIEYIGRVTKNRRARRAYGICGIIANYVIHDSVTW